MIIVKQDKKGIVNFNNVTDIYIDKEDDGDRHFVFYIPVSNIDGLDILGIYETEERAKEVLQEIIRAYAQEDFYHIRKSQVNEICSLEEPKFIIQKVSRPKIYEMPENKGE